MKTRPRNNDEKVAFARRLLQEVECDERSRRIRTKNDEADKMPCKCGHTRKNHLPSHSINYTGGPCKKCDCKNFLMA